MGVDLKQEAKALAEYNAEQLNIKNVTFAQAVGLSLLQKVRSLL